jgi:ABC-type nickel/cobalt efflux system permease component RcnA
MLYAMANDMLVTGILMTAAIAAGMAATMSGLGILTILARQTVLRWVETGGQKPGRARRVLEIGGATVLLAFSALMLIGSL